MPHRRYWWRPRDLNPASDDYKSPALTSYARAPYHSSLGLSTARRSFTLHSSSTLGMSPSRLKHIPLCMVLITTYFYQPSRVRRDSFAHQLGLPTLIDSRACSSNHAHPWWIPQPCLMPRTVLFFHSSKDIWSWFSTRSIFIGYMFFSAFNACLPTINTIKGSIVYLHTLV